MFHPWDFFMGGTARQDGSTQDTTGPPRTPQEGHPMPPANDPPHDPDTPAKREAGEARSATEPGEAPDTARSGTACHRLTTKHYEVVLSPDAQRAWVRDLATGRRSVPQTGPQARAYFQVAQRLYAISRRTFNHWCRHHAWQRDDARSDTPAKNP
jgi:hypothetical protein